MAVIAHVICAERTCGRRLHVFPSDFFGVIPQDIETQTAIATRLRDAQTDSDDRFAVADADGYFTCSGCGTWQAVPPGLGTERAQGDDGTDA